MSSLVARCLAATALALGLGLGVGPGCGSSEPQVATDVPRFDPKPDPTPSGKPVKGMPKQTSAGMQIDPATGRPMGPKS
jgi:hypothetical protein